MTGAADRPPTRDSQGQTTSLDVPSFVPITGWLLEKCPSSNQAYGFFQGINIMCGGDEQEDNGAFPLLACSAVRCSVLFWEDGSNAKTNPAHSMHGKGIENTYNSEFFL